MPERCWIYTVSPVGGPRLDAVLTYRWFGAPASLAEFRGSLTEHEVPVPDGLQLEPVAEDTPPRFLTKTPSE